MAISSKIKRGIWEGLGELEAPNTFIGGAGEEYTTAMELATAMDIPYVAIKNFRIDANYNISCRIDRDYNITTNAFSKYGDANRKFERYFIDADGLLKSTTFRSFAENPNLKMLLPGLEIWGSQTIGFTGNGPVLLYAPQVIDTNQEAGMFAHNWRNGADRVYIPNFNPPYEDTQIWLNYQLNNATGRKNVAYVNASFFNHPNTIEKRTKSGIKLDARIVTNFDCPNPVEDLTVSVNTYDGLIKTSPNGWDAEATAEEMFIGDTEVSMEAFELSTTRGIGLNAVESTGINTFDYFVNLHRNNAIAVREGENFITNITTYSVGDIISIHRNGTIITYRKNGVTFHTSTIPAPTTGMYVRAMASTNGATIYNAKLGTTPITWKNLVNFQNSVADVTLNFTTPAPSTNPIDFYEVWLEELGVNDPEYRYFPHSEITASGHIIRGLKANTNYVIRLATVDTLYNGSGVHSDPNMRRFSNQVIFQT